MADADTLVVGQRDGAMLAPPAPSRQGREPGRERDGALLPERRETGRGPVQRGAQIVMRAKQRPRLRIHPRDVDDERRPTLKKPPGESVLRRTIRPIRIEPRLDVLVAGD